MKKGHFLSAFVTARGPRMLFKGLGLAELEITTCCVDLYASIVKVRLNFKSHFIFFEI